MKLYDRNITAIKDHIIVSDMEFGERITHGIIKLADDGETTGIRPRWGRVYSIGPNQKDVKIGEWVLINHGRWTRGVEIHRLGKKFTVRRIDSKDILVVADRPSEDY